MSDLASIAAELERQLLIIQAGLDSAVKMIADKDAKIKELEHCLKVEREEVKRYKQMHRELTQRSGAGRWM